MDGGFCAAGRCVSFKDIKACNIVLCLRSLLIGSLIGVMAVLFLPKEMFVEDTSKKILDKGKKSYSALRDSSKRGTVSAIPNLGKSIAQKQEEYVDRTLGCRYEMKYVISEEKAVAIARFLRPYMKMDRYSKLQPDGRYPIVSTYLDSPDLHLCRETMEGHKNRFKLRVRGYSDDPESPIFFEIKRRINTVIMKSRARVRREYLADLLAGRFLRPTQNYKTDEDVLKQFQLYMLSLNAKPVVRIRYMREAYECDGENRVRITFDRDMCFNVDDSPIVKLGGAGWINFSGDVGGVVLEIKFTGRYPAWISQMTECFNLTKGPMSKYASSIKKACILRFCAPKLPMIA